MKVSFPQQLFWSLPILLAFLLPIGGSILSFVIVAWLLFSFFNLNRKQIQKGLRTKAFWYFLFFFIYTCLSAAISKNKTEALSAIEIKLSFLLFPWLYFCFEYPAQILKKCLVAFVSGNFFACLYLLLRATVYAVKGDADYFFYTKFSDFIHASYFSMYLIFAITIIVMFYGKWFHFQKQMQYLSYFFIALFTLCIFLCSSKLGIISFFILVPMLFLYKNPRFLKLKFLVLTALACVLLFVVAYKTFPDSFQRLNSITNLHLSAIDKTSKESTTVRILIWQQAWTLSLQNPVFGLGVGDANNYLYEAYAANGLTGALQYHLNAHNQYLQSFIGLGLIGLVLLFQFTWIQLLKAFQSKRFLLFVFAFLISFNFLVESMLQTAAGVLFFCFFYCFNHLVTEKNLYNA